MPPRHAWFEGGVVILAGHFEIEGFLGVALRGMRCVLDSV